MGLRRTGVIDQGQSAPVVSSQWSVKGPRQLVTSEGIQFEGVLGLGPVMKPEGQEEASRSA